MYVLPDLDLVQINNKQENYILVNKIYQFTGTCIYSTLY